MIRRIDTNVIADTTTYIIDQTKKIQNAQKKLKNNILKIKDCYRGKDADLIIQKYEEKTNELNIMIQILYNYISYFKWLSGSYRESLHAASTNLANNLKNSSYDLLSNTNSMYLNLDKIQGEAGDIK